MKKEFLAVYDYRTGGARAPAARRARLCNPAYVPPRRPTLMPPGTGSALRLPVAFFWRERTLAAPQQPVLVRLDGMSE